MSAKSIYNKVLLGISYCLMTGAVAAGTNPITLTFVGGTTSFSVGNPGTANYAACRDPQVPAGTLPLYFNDLGGGNYASQITTGGSTCTGISTVCAAPFSIASGSCCCLKLGLNTNGNLSAGTYSLIAEVGTQPDSTNPAYGGQAQPLAVQVSSAPSGTTLAVFRPITLPLALSVNCTSSSDPYACTTTTNAALTGNPRTITIKNIGSNPADITTVTPSGLPSNTSITSDGCASTTLAAGATCTITITPGQNASSDCTTGIAPTAGSISVNASNATTVSAGVEVLSYGCIYQDGYIYSIDDTTANTGSISGKVTQETDNSGASTGILWDSSSGCTNPPYNACYITNADSGTNGTNLSSPSPGGNTYLIYLTLTTTHNELATSYAAGLCTGDWYLPAICEMGFSTSSGGINCGTSGSPLIQNMQSNLFGPNQTTDIAGLTTGYTLGYYWSSTEYSVFPTTGAWVQDFALSGGNSQYPDIKGSATLGVRCSRGFE